MGIARRLGSTASGARRARPIGRWPAAVDAPPEFKGDPRYIRFIYDFETKVHQIEMHRLWVTGASVSQAIVDRNRELFDGIWKDQCAAFHP